MFLDSTMLWNEQMKFMVLIEAPLYMSESYDMRITRIERCFSTNPPSP